MNNGDSEGGFGGTKTYELERAYASTAPAQLTASNTPAMQIMTVAGAVRTNRRWKGTYFAGC